MIIPNKHHQHIMNLLTSKVKFFSGLSSVSLTQTVLNPITFKFNSIDETQAFVIKKSKNRRHDEDNGEETSESDFNSVYSRHVLDAIDLTTYE